MVAAPVRPVVHARAPGKINVALKVGALQPDGFHDVATVYQAVSLYEQVTARPASDVTVEVCGSVDTGGVPLDDTNIAVRAARMLADDAGYAGGAHLVIEKNVPVAGGMGGGSADAAAALIACDALWGAERSREQLLALAARLGSDVPFALVGGTAVGRGRGDRLSPALAKGGFHWVLVTSEHGHPTPEVYRELDAHRERHARDIPAVGPLPSVDADVLAALRAGDPRMLAETLVNDLQAPALHLTPDLARILELGEASGALAGIVSGSGPTLAFLAADLDSALEVQIALSAARHTAVRVTGPVHGARLTAA